MSKSAHTRVEPLRDYENFQRSLRDFHSWLGPVVSGGCDIDFVVERNGRFLFIEAKPFEGQGIFLGYGQHLLLYRLSQQPNTSVWLVGEAGDYLYSVDYSTPIPPKMFRRRGKMTVLWEPSRLEQTTKEGLQEEVESWWGEASQAVA